jgi:hypothetical protein
MSFKNIYSYKNNSNKNTKYDKDIISYLKRLGFPLLFLLNNQTDEICLEAVNQKYYTTYAMKNIINQTEEICLSAVKQDGMALEFVKIQTNEICLIAVKQNGLALQFVKEQTEEICLFAVRQNGLALRFVENQTEEIIFSNLQIKLGVIPIPITNCVICLSNINEKWCEIKECKHQFHFNCLINWIKEKDNCPCCRNQIKRS